MANRSLSEKLKSLGVRIGAGDLPPPRPRPRPYPRYPIDEVVPGQFRDTSHGQAFVVETRYPAEYQYGATTLEVTAPLEVLAGWARDTRLADLDPGRFAFLDTETSGLSGGTGTYAFMVGVGCYGDQGFRLAQFFMRDPVEEPALLQALSDFLQGLEGLVTFNGKAFDVPLLNTRYTLNGMPSPLARMAHVDLLALARRLWRRRLASRALGCLETHILEITRTQEDVPGWYIPQMYFEYLRTGDARPLKGIFYHNAMDILSLAALLNHVAHLLDDPLSGGIEHPLDLVDLGNLFEDMGDWDTASRLYDRGLHRNLPLEARDQTTRRLAVLQRRRGNLLAAVDLWHQAAGENHVYAHVELAKYYEHRTHEYGRAAGWTQTAVDLVKAPGFPRYDRRRWLAELEHRLNRLHRKIGRT